MWDNIKLTLTYLCRLTVIVLIGSPRHNRVNMPRPPTLGLWYIDSELRMRAALKFDVTNARWLYIHINSIVPRGSY